jgi:type III restriction enzyme
MATGSGKTTVMGMIAAWSILNKVHERSNARYSDVVLVVCPNVTIRSRLGEAPEVPRYETSRGPGSTADVYYWTSRDVREVSKSHVNYVVADTIKWEQQAAYIIDTHSVVDAFVKNAGLGFAIPYIHNGQPNNYIPDFVIRLKTEPPIQLILETKGFDDLADVKAATAERWVAAVNADNRMGTWRYEIARNVERVRETLDSFSSEP